MPGRTLPAAAANAAEPAPATAHGAALHSLGLKVTGPRLKVLEVFRRDGPRHLGAEDIHRVLLAEGADVGLATVYRALMQFEQAGLLRRSQFDAGPAVFELEEGQHHDHLLCLDCGRVEEFVDPDIERRQHRLAESRGFRLAEHTLALYAHCVREGCPHRAGGAPGAAVKTRRTSPPPAPSGGAG